MGDIFRNQKQEMLSKIIIKNILRRNISRHASGMLNFITGIYDIILFILNHKCIIDQRLLPSQNKLGRRWLFQLIEEQYDDYERGTYGT